MSLNLICPKCDWARNRVTHDPVFNRMDLRCSICGYQWHLAPLDMVREDYERQYAERHRDRKR